MEINDIGCASYGVWADSEEIRANSSVTLGELSKQELIFYLRYLVLNLTPLRTPHDRYTCKAFIAIMSELKREIKESSYYEESSIH